MVAATSEDALRMAVKMCNGVGTGQHKIVWIQNTLELITMLISEPLLTALLTRPRFFVLRFKSGVCLRFGPGSYFKTRVILGKSINKSADF